MGHLKIQLHLKLDTVVRKPLRFAFSQIKLTALSNFDKQTGLSLRSFFYHPNFEARSVEPIGKEILWSRQLPRLPLSCRICCWSFPSVASEDGPQYVFPDPGFGLLRAELYDTNLSHATSSRGSTGLRHDLRLSLRFKTCFKMLRHFF